MAEKKTILRKKDTVHELHVTCETADSMGLDEMTPFQGGLKTLSEKNYQKLRASILKFGISFPFYIWKSDEKNYVLDAHQRCTTLKRMREDGYGIPSLPIVRIQAANRKEAAEKLLALNSQFGEMTPNGLFDFIKTNELNFDSVVGDFELRSIDFNEMRRIHFTPAKDVNFKAGSAADQGQLDQLNPVIVTCPNCRHEFDIKKS